MTTIAARDGVVACDSQVCFADTRVGTVAKMVSRSGVVCAGTGWLPGVVGFHDWFRGGMRGRVRQQRQEEGLWWTGILVHPGGVVTREQNAWMRVEAPFHAWGSGWQLAMGAMAAGASAEMAVALASTMDLGTGGRVEVMHVRER